MHYLTRGRPRFDTLRYLARSGGSAEYRLHQLVWKLFSDHDDRRRDFVWRYNADEGKLWIVSERDPVVTDAWNLQTCEYDPKLTVGDHLEFQLLANAVVRTKNDNGKRVRHDVVMHRKKNPEQGDEELREAELAFDEGLSWFRRQGERLGFRPATDGDDAPVFRVDAYRQHRFEKSRNSRTIRFSTLDLAGVVQVTDPKSMSKALFDGIGPSKAYGCGLMLVRRV